MKAEWIMKVATLGLLVALGVQLGVRYSARSQPRHIALWKERPTSVEAAAALSQNIVRGIVTRVRRADDMVATIPGQPSEVDRIPMEVVTLLVDRSDKGSTPNSIEIMHTGSQDLAVPSTVPDPNTVPPPKPPDGQERPPGFIDRSRDGEARLFVLDDDPSYRPGQRYVLFLREGPRLTLQGAVINTKTIVAPEGRFQVLANNRLSPATVRGFAGQLKDKLLQELESKIPR